MITYSTTEARSKLSELVNTVKYQKIIIAICRNNKAEVLLTPLPEEKDIPISEINATSESFDFLKDEPDIYTINDLKKRYV
jgi:hypothetical protein